MPFWILYLRFVCFSPGPKIRFIVRLPLSDPWPMLHLAAVHPSALRTGALQVPIAHAVIAAAFLHPSEAAVHIVSLVGLILIETGEHSRSASGLAGIFRRYRPREYRTAHRCGIANACRLEWFGRV